MILYKSARIVASIILIVLVLSCSRESRIFIGKWERERSSDCIKIYKDHRCKASLSTIFSEEPSDMVISEPVNICWEVTNPEEEFESIVSMDGIEYKLDGITSKAQFIRPEVRTEKDGKKSYWLILEGSSEVDGKWRIKEGKTMEVYVVGRDQKTDSEREFIVFNLTPEDSGLRLSHGEVPSFIEGVFLKG